MSNVHEIKRKSLLDAPGKLRALADELELKDIATSTTVAVVLGYSCGRVAVRGYGERSSALMVTGWLARALSVLTEGSDADDADGYTWEPPGAA